MISVKKLRYDGFSSPNRHYADLVSLRSFHVWSGVAWCSRSNSFSTRATWLSVHADAEVTTRKQGWLPSPKDLSSQKLQWGFQYIALFRKCGRKVVLLPGVYSNIVKVKLSCSGCGRSGLEDERWMSLPFSIKKRGQANPDLPASSLLSLYRSLRTAYTK